MVGFYRRLISNFADAVLQLTDTIRDNPKSKSLILTQEAKLSFSDFKSKLANITATPHPVTTATYYHLVTDASGYAVGSAGVPIRCTVYLFRLDFTLRK